MELHASNSSFACWNAAIHLVGGVTELIELDVVAAIRKGKIIQMYKESGQVAARLAGEK